MSRVYTNLSSINQGAHERVQGTDLAEAAAALLAQSWMCALRLRSRGLSRNRFFTYMREQSVRMNSRSGESWKDEGPKGNQRDEKVPHQVIYV